MVGAQVRSQVLLCALALGLMTAVTVAAVEWASTKGHPLLTGPVDLSHHGAICLPMPRYEHVAFGTQLDVKAGGPVTIKSVALVGLENARVISEHVMKGDVGNRLFAANWPMDAVYGAPWKAAVSATGAHIAANASVDVVTEIEPIDSSVRAHIRALRITYQTSDGILHQATSDYQFFLSARHCDDAKI